MVIPFRRQIMFRNMIATGENALSLNYVEIKPLIKYPRVLIHSAHDTQRNIQIEGRYTCDQYSFARQRTIKNSKMNFFALRC